MREGGRHVGGSKGGMERQGEGVREEGTERGRGREGGRGKQLSHGQTAFVSLSFHPYWLDRLEE